MKIGLILPGNIWFCPYVNIYTQILDKEKVDYDLISWNRDGTDKSNGYQYNKRIDNLSNPIIKLILLFFYIKFIKKIVRHNKYDRLIVFGPQIAIFISNFLIKYYKKRFIFDYRDLSIEQRFFLRKRFVKVLGNSFVNVISSPGFKRCLPNNFNYLLSHNFNVESVRKSLNENETYTHLNDKNVIVLTIGGIRDYESNIEVVKALANRKKYRIQFVGRGYAANSIEEYSKKHNIMNIAFEGYYPKEKEAEYIKQSNFLNIFYPRALSHDTALSNRFYNALIYKKPMIVTTDTTQGNYVDTYQLGLSLENCENLDDKINNYIKDFDPYLFTNNCNKLLVEFLDDYEKFENSIKEFIRH